MSNALGQVSSTSELNQKKRFTMKRNCVQKFEDNWDCELIVDHKQKADIIQQPRFAIVKEKYAALKATIAKPYNYYFTKSTQNDEHCTDTKIFFTCSRGSDPKTSTNTEVPVKIGKNDKLKTSSEKSEENESGCAKIPAENGGTEGQETERRKSKQEDSVDETRVVKLLEIDTDNDSCTNTDAFEEINVFSFNESKENEANVSAEVDLANVHRTGSGTNRQDAFEDENSFEKQMETGTMDKLQTFSGESGSNEAHCTNSDCPAEVERNNLKETGRGGTIVQGSSEAEPPVVKLMKMAAHDVSFLDVSDEMSCISIKDKPVENESRSEILMQTGTNDKLQKFSEESKGTEMDCVNIPVKVDLKCVQEADSATSRQDESGDETCTELSKGIGEKDNIQRFSEEELGVNEAACGNIPPKGGVLIACLQGTGSETKKQDATDDDFRTKVLPTEIEAKDDLQTFSKEFEGSTNDIANIPADIDRADAQGNRGGTSRQNEYGDETRLVAELMEIDANNDDPLLASDEMSYFTNNSAELEQSEVKCVVNKTNSLNDSMTGKRNSGKRQIYTPPVRRSTRLKSRGGTE